MTDGNGAAADGFVHRGRAVIVGASLAGLCAQPRRCARRDLPGASP